MCYLTLPAREGLITPIYLENLRDMQKRTYSQSKEDALSSRQWLIVDAAGAPLGRLASEVATLIRGKHKPTYTPHVDGGDFVVVLNASKVKLTGKKSSQKVYQHHTGYVGGIKTVPFEKMISDKPERVIELAVKRMLPKGALGHQMVKKLKVYSGTEHPHEAQKPEKYDLKYIQ